MASPDRPGLLEGHRQACAGLKTPRSGLEVTRCYFRRCPRSSDSSPTHMRGGGPQPRSVRMLRGLPGPGSPTSGPCGPNEPPAQPVGTKASATSASTPPAATHSGLWSPRPQALRGPRGSLPPTRWHPAASWQPSSLAPLPAPCADSEHTCPHLPLRCQVLPWVLALPPTVASAWGRCTPWLPRDPLGTPNACLMPRPSSGQAARRREEAWRQGPARSLRPRGHSHGRRAAGGPALHHRSETGGCACRRRPE